MAGRPWIAADGRPRIRVDWHTPSRQPQSLEFLIDSGATRSCVDLASVQQAGLTFVGGMNLIGSTGSATSYLLDGGEMEFEVVDSSGASTMLRHGGSVLLAGQRIVGVDVITEHNLRFIFDYGRSPVEARLEV